MPTGGASRGFLLSLLTESFAVRALLGTLAAAVLGTLAGRLGLVRDSRARRLLVLAPVLAAVAAAVASDVYLPQLWLTTANRSAAGQLLELLGELRGFSTDRIDLLLIGWAAVAGVLLLRRATGVLAVRRLLHRSVPAGRDGPLVPLARRLAVDMRVRCPRIVLLPECPGGAFTTGALRPVVALDPALLERLDACELEGLVAHELAHVARHDNLLGAAVGVCCDLTFFLPSMRLALRWLRREQEESADERACAQTRRPGALASSILKVWDASRWCQVPQVACAALGALRPAPARGLLTGQTRSGPRGAALGDAAGMIAARVERLIERAPELPRWRRSAEGMLASMVLALGTTAAIVLPSWIATELNAYSLSFWYLGAPLQEPGPAEPVTESPALATFRALAPQRPSAEGLTTSAARLQPGASPQADGCPCVETQAQLRAGRAATGLSRADGMLWRSEDRKPWELDDTRRARPLWTLTDAGPQVGVFLVGRAGD